MLRAALLGGAVVSVCLVAAPLYAPAQTASQPAAQAASGPDALFNTWQRSDREARFLPSAAGGPGPVKDDPAHPHTGHRDGVNGAPDIEATPWIADLTNTNLQPWVTEALKKKAAEGLAGADDQDKNFVFCRPVGVPGALMLLEPVQIVHTGDVVTMIYQRPQMTRHIYMNQPHSKNLKSTWFGESVGHFEGDTLVVDTIGMNDKTRVDLYSTPHTDQIHTVERYRVTEGGKTLQVDFTVEDSKAFKQPWSAMVHYRKVEDGIQEIVCSENNIDEFTKIFRPIPIASKADF